MERQTLSASSLIGDEVVNYDNEHLGNIKEIMFGVNSGDISYAVVSFGGILGLGDKYFAIPWRALEVDQLNHKVILGYSKAELEMAPGFDKRSWPDADSKYWREDIEAFYNKYNLQNPEL